MATFNSLEIASTLSSDARIQIKKSFLGTKVTYQPTGCSIKSSKKEYSVEDGEKIQAILSQPEDALLGNTDQKPFTEAGLGNYKLELCLAADRQFAALRLYRFSELCYTPVTDLKIYEGKAAERVAALF